MMRFNGTDVEIRAVELSLQDRHMLVFGLVQLKTRMAEVAAEGFDNSDAVKRAQELIDKLSAVR